jgi:allantoinase
MYDLIIRCGKIVEPTQTRIADIAVSDGQIVEIAAEIPGNAKLTIDASGLHVLPGVVDTHVHFNEPGRTDWEGIATGSRAIAAGGGTVFCDMPLNSTPPVIDAAAFEAKRRAASEKSCTDFGIWGGLTPNNLANMEELAACGVIGFKAFMTNSGIEDFTFANEETLHAGMQIAARLNLPVAVHAEDEETTAQFTAEARKAGKTGVRDYLESRPASVEIIAIERAIRIAQATGCSLHIVHVSMSAGVELVAAARARGVQVTCETCPHYLVLCDRDVERLGAVAKCSPVIRDHAEVQKLWQQVLIHNVDLIASDHSPAPDSMKQGNDFFAIWGGIAGCQSMLPLMLKYGHLGRCMDLKTICKLLSDAPAARFRLPNKGKISVGYDADFALIDMTAKEELHSSNLRYRYQSSPYVGLPIHGFIQQTLVRGTSVWGPEANLEFRGKLLKPATN